MKESKKLMLNFLGYSLLILLIIGAILTIFIGTIAMWVAGALYVTVATVTVVKAWTQIPYKWVYVIDRYGDFYRLLKPGLHFIFPWLGFYTIKRRIFTGELKMALFDKVVEESEDYQGGIIDFKDESSKIKSFLFFRVRMVDDLSDKEKEMYKNDLIKKGELKDDSSEEDIESKIQVELYKIAAYETNDPIAYIKVKAESALRSFLAQYEVLEANELKSNFDINEVSNMMGPEEVKDRKKEEKKKREQAEKAKKDGITNKESDVVDVDKSWENSKFGKILINWGFVPNSFSISEIQLADRIIEQRARRMKASTDEKIAAHKKNEMEILSEGEANALENMSVARSSEVNRIKNENNCTTEEAFLFIINRQKYEALAKAGNVTWIGGADGDEVKRGASFGTGFKK